MAQQKMNGLRARIDYLLKHSAFVYKAYQVIMSGVMRFWGWFLPIDTKLIVFTAHTRRYNDSPKAIYEYMISNPIYSSYKYVWAVDDPENTIIPGPAIKIKADTVEYFRTTLKAKYWITCVNIERGLIYKKKNCKYLNTWHGVALKSIDNVDARGNDDFSYVDYMCYESEYQKNILKKSFNAQEEHLIPTGLPRNDALYNTTEEEIIALKNKLNLPLDKRIILYAPTWRDSNDRGQSYFLKPPMNVSYWQQELESEYVMLFRMHAYTNKVMGLEYNYFMRDVSEYPSINDLMKVSDILISDYSACIVDYSILERPIVCFAYDYEEYSSTRGLNLDFEKEMPCGILRTEEEVIKHIKSIDYAQECEKTKMFKNKYTYIGGNATQICVEILFGK